MGYPDAKCTLDFWRKIELDYLSMSNHNFVPQHEPGRLEPEARLARPCETADVAIKIPPSARTGQGEEESLVVTITAFSQ